MAELPEEPLPDMPETRPAIRLEFTGQNPPPGKVWCAICAMLYMGTLTEDKVCIEQTTQAVNQGIKEGRAEVYWPLPDREDRILRPAITTWFSNQCPNVRSPVCWVHIKPFTIQDQTLKPSALPENRLIPGKNFGWKGQIT